MKCSRGALLLLVSPTVLSFAPLRSPIAHLRANHKRVCLPAAVPDHYGILEINDEADDAAIKSAFRSAGVCVDDHRNDLESLSQRSRTQRACAILT
jgi:hypothetical protein